MYGVSLLFSAPTDHIICLDSIEAYLIIKAHVLSPMDNQPKETQLQYFYRHSFLSFIENSARYKVRLLNTGGHCGKRETLPVTRIDTCQNREKC